MRWPFWWALKQVPIFRLPDISLVGNILIFCVGINLVWPRTIKVANLLPSLLVAVAMTGIV